MQLRRACVNTETWMTTETKTRLFGKGYAVIWFGGVLTRSGWYGKTSPQILGLGASFFNNCSFFILVVFRSFSGICGELQCCSKKEPCSSSITLFGKLSGSSPFPTVCCQLLNVCQQKHYPSLPLLTHVSPQASLREPFIKAECSDHKAAELWLGFQLEELAELEAALVGTAA